MERNNHTISTYNIGRTRYAEAWDLQQKVWDLRHRGSIGDVLLLTEHEHVYTIGKGGDENHVLANDEELVRTGAEMFRIDRGGDVTYHGPGQLVGYPILDLNNSLPDIHQYLRNLEEVIILTLRELGLEGGREEGMTGVWVRGEKIAALGVKVSRWITMHGFALNVNTDLSRFDRIIPCGIFHKGVTSLERLLGHSVALGEVEAHLCRSFGRVFRAEMKAADLQALTGLLQQHSKDSVRTSAA